MPQEVVTVSPIGANSEDMSCMKANTVIGIDMKGGDLIMAESELFRHIQVFEPSHGDAMEVNSVCLE